MHRTEIYQRIIEAEQVLSSYHYDARSRFLRLLPTEPSSGNAGGGGAAIGSFYRLRRRIVRADQAQAGERPQACRAVSLIVSTQLLADTEPGIHRRLMAIE